MPINVTNNTHFNQDPTIPTIVEVASAGTHFVDQNGNPRLFVGENAWALLVNGGAWNSGNYQATFDTYLSSRAAQGYTAVEVCWASWPAVAAGLVNIDGRDWDGAYPFSSTTNPSTAANETFWARRDYFFQAAAANGITVVMNMTTTAMGFDQPEVFQRNWTNQQWTDFGTFFGNRYKNQPNILWNCGDDYFGDFDTQFGLMRTACRAAGDTHPWSIMWYQEATSRQDLFTLTKNSLPFSVHAEYEWIYTYNVSYDGVEKAQIYTPSASDDVQHIVPAVWADGFYLASGTSGTTDTRLERQLIWWAFSSGACGISTGDNDTWTWPSTAAAVVTSKSFYSSVMPAVTTAFKNLPGWHLLQPDTSSQLVTAGRGTHASPITSGGSGTPYIGNTDNYVTAARTPDTGSGSSLAVIYCGLAMSITIDQSKMAAGYTVTWIDPVSGATSAGTPGSTYNSATAKGNNSAGDPDWVLVLKA